MRNQSYARVIASTCLLGALFSSCKSDDDGPNLGNGDPNATSDGGGGASTSNDGGRSPTGSSRGDGGQGGGRTPQMCPAIRPTNGSACVPGRGDCTIGVATCECDDDTNKWVCWEPSDCPSVVPAEAAACTIVGAECTYDLSPDAGRGNNEDLDCECTAAGWDCGRQACPAAEPAANAACEGGDGMCTFGGRTCDCRSRRWVCWNASDCPTTAPAAGSACPVERMLCELPGDECECTARGWECESQEDDNRPRRDAGVRSDAGMQPGTTMTDAAVTMIDAQVP